jgi:hypothetical protein
MRPEIPAYVKVIHARHTHAGGKGGLAGQVLVLLVLLLRVLLLLLLLRLGLCLLLLRLLLQHFVLFIMMHGPRRATQQVLLHQARVPKSSVQSERNAFWPPLKAVA